MIQKHNQESIDMSVTEYSTPAKKGNAGTLGSFFSYVKRAKSEFRHPHFLTRILLDASIIVVSKHLNPNSSVRNATPGYVF